VSETQLQGAKVAQEQTLVELAAAQANGAQLRAEVAQYKTTLSATTAELDASKHSLTFKDVELNKVRARPTRT
jgi:hypothetical protein